MQSEDDSELVRQYADHRVDEAFSALVARYINLVYSIALRHVGDRHQAEEITQAVFVLLARKAESLRGVKNLAGWLFQATRLTAINFLRSEARRHRREQEAYMQSELNEPERETWRQIAPLLDSAVADLGEKDRHAIVLRFYEGRNLREVGLALGASEDAADKRVGRALEKLRKFFVKRGVASTTAVIAGAISANSIQAAPALLAGSITAATVSKGAAAGSSTSTLVKGVLKVMAWTKAKTAIVAGTGILLAAGTATVTVQKIHKSESPSAWRVPGFNSRVLDQSPPQVAILPTVVANGGSWGSSGQKVMGTGVSAAKVVQAAYDLPKKSLSEMRMIIPPELPSGKYDFIASLPRGNAEAMQREVKKVFGVIARYEVRDASVLVLKVKQPGAKKLKATTVNDGTAENSTDAGRFFSRNQSIVSLSFFLEEYFAVPVIDRTGLTGNFDIDIRWAGRDWDHRDHDALKKVLTDELGLEVVSAREPIEMLVVEAVK